MSESKPLFIDGGSLVTRPRKCPLDIQVSVNYDLPSLDVLPSPSSTGAFVVDYSPKMKSALPSKVKPLEISLLSGQEQSYMNYSSETEVASPSSGCIHVLSGEFSRAAEIRSSTFFPAESLSEISGGAFSRSDDQLGDTLSSTEFSGSRAQIYSKTFFPAADLRDGLASSPQGSFLIVQSPKSSTSKPFLQVGNETRHFRS